MVDEREALHDIGQRLALVVERYARMVDDAEKGLLGDITTRIETTEWELAFLITRMQELLVQRRFKENKRATA